MLICTPSNFFLSLLKNKENASKLKEAIYLVTGENYAIKAKCIAPKDGDAASSAENDRMLGILKKARENNVPVEE